MTMAAPPPTNTMSPRRAYLLVVGGDLSRFVGSEMPSPPPNCIPPKADIQRSNGICSVQTARLPTGNRMPQGQPVANHHMMNRFSSFVSCLGPQFTSHTDSFSTVSDIDTSGYYVVNAPKLLDRSLESPNWWGPNRRRSGPRHQSLARTERAPQLHHRPLSSGSAPLRAGGAVRGNHMARPRGVSPWRDQ